MRALVYSVKMIKRTTFRKHNIIRPCSQKPPAGIPVEKRGPSTARLPYRKMDTNACVFSLQQCHWCDGSCARAVWQYSSCPVGSEGEGVDACTRLHRARFVTLCTSSCHGPHTCPEGRNKSITHEILNQRHKTSSPNTPNIWRSTYWYVFNFLVSLQQDGGPVRALLPSLISLLHQIPRYGTHHAKMMILKFQTGVRVVVLTANFVSMDVEDKSQAAWYQEFPLRESETCDFEVHMTKTFEIAKHFFSRERSRWLNKKLLFTIMFCR